MNFRLEKIKELSGRVASVYTVLPDGDQASVFEQFLDEYNGTYQAELDDIVSRLHAIGHKTGARASFFKEGEGKWRDLVCALYDEPERKLRLYCLRWGGDFIILGGGGPKNTRTWQEDENLSYHAEMMIAVAKRVHRRFKDGELKWTAGYKDITGDLEFKDEEDD